MDRKSQLYSRAEYHNNFFTDSTFYKTHVNHFDYFEGDVEKIWETHTDDIGKLATYWSTDIFNHFNDNKNIKILIYIISSSLQFTS